MQKFQSLVGLWQIGSFMWCLFVCGCAPIAGGPPPTRMPSDSTYDAGVAHTTAFQLPSEDYGSQIFLEEAIWMRRAIGEKSEVHLTTGIFWGGGFSYYGVLGYRRYFAFSESRTVAIDARLGGPFYGEIGFPVQQNIRPKLWLTTHPAIGLNGFGFVHLPVGLSWAINDNVQLNMSIGSRFGTENAMLLYMNSGVSFPF